MSEASIGFKLSAIVPNNITDDPFRSDALHGTHIDLYQDMPPASEDRDRLIRKALTDLDQDARIANALRFHRYQGTDRDRTYAADWLSRRFGKRPDPARVAVTHGTQSALLMILSTMVGTGGTLLTEELTYPSIKVLAQFLGLQIRGVEFDECGPRPDAFAKLCMAPGPKIFYCIPTIHNPTTRITTLERRKEIISVARKYGVRIIEDDAYGLYPSESIEAIASLAPDITWYVFTVAKSISIQLRLCLVVAPDERDVHLAFGSTSRLTFWMAAPLSAEVLGRLVDDGSVDVLLDGIRRESAVRQTMVSEILRGHEFETKPQAPHLWLTLPQTWTRRKFADAARSSGILVNVSDPYTVSPHIPPEAIRICIGAPSRNELETGLRRIATLLASKAH